jgi:hypothetical protein
MVIPIMATPMAGNLMDTGLIPITDTDPTLTSVGMAILTEVLGGVGILGGLVVMVGTAVDTLGGAAAMDGTVVDIMDGVEGMATTDAYVFAM